MSCYNLNRKQKAIKGNKHYKWKGGPKTTAQNRKERLADCYVKSNLVHGTCLKMKEIPRELIEMKRAQLKLIRLIRESKQNGEDDSSKRKVSGNDSKPGNIDKKLAGII
jgi:hypothetical protein